MKKRIIALGLLWCLSAVMLQAARVDTVLVRSAAMNKDVKVVYVLPDKAIGKQACPVVYLLHGYGGNARSWVQLKPELPQMADEKGLEAKSNAPPSKPDGMFTAASCVLAYTSCAALVK